MAKKMSREEIKKELLVELHEKGCFEALEGDESILVFKGLSKQGISGLAIDIDGVVDHLVETGETPKFAAEQLMAALISTASENLIDLTKNSGNVPEGDKHMAVLIQKAMSKFDPKQVRGCLFWANRENMVVAKNIITYFPSNLRANIGVRFQYIVETTDEYARSFIITKQHLEKWGVDLSAEDLFKIALDNVTNMEVEAMKSIFEQMKKDSSIPSVLVDQMIESLESQDETLAIALFRTGGRDISGAFAIFTPDGQELLRQLATVNDRLLFLVPMSTGEWLIMNQFPFSSFEAAEEGMNVLNNLQGLFTDGSEPLYDKPLIYDLDSESIWDPFYLTDLVDDDEDEE